MGKRVRRSSLCSKQKMDNHFTDKITHLPKEILIYILSLLTLKEAGRSSVLSHGWRDLWKFTTVLNFDSPQSLRFCGKMCRNRERSKYVTWVNQVLELHQSPYHDGFRVSFDMNRDASHDIDEWISFAIPKGMRRLKIDFTSYLSGSESRYSLSQKSFALSEPTGFPDPMWCSPAMVEGEQALSSFKLLILNGIAASFGHGEIYS